MTTTFKFPINTSKKKLALKLVFLWLDKLIIQIYRYPLEIVRRFAEQSLAIEIYCSYNGGNKK